MRFVGLPLILAVIIAVSLPDALQAQSPEYGGLGSELRAELRAPDLVMLSAPAAGRLAAVNVKDGEPIATGQVLIQIDDTLPRLRLDMAIAARDQAGTQLRLAEKLYDLGSRGALDVEMARAHYRGAEAEMNLAAEMVNLCQVKAPWNGRVTRLEVVEHQHVPEGAPLLEVAREGPMEVEFMMPSSWLTRLLPGSPFEVRVDETGQNYPAELLRLGGKVDPVTQSIRIYGRLKGRPEGLVPGMSGVVVWPDFPQAATAHE